MEAVVYFLLWALLLFFVMRFGCGAHVMGHARNRRSAHGSNSNLTWIAPEQDIDPVCKNSVRPENAKSSVYEGHVYYFCSRDCREIFEAAPREHIENTNAEFDLEPSHA